MRRANYVASERLVPARWEQRLVRTRPVPRAGEGGAHEVLRVAVDRSVDDAPRAATAAENYAVGVALDPIQHLGVTGHERSFLPALERCQASEDEQSANAP
jgi:hypothetical protein